MRVTDHVEAHRAGIDLISVPRLICELDSVISEYSMDPVGHRLEEMLQELPSGFTIRFVEELGHRAITRSVNANREIQRSFRGMHLSYIDMEEADRVVLKLLPFGLIAADSSSREIP